MTDQITHFLVIFHADVVMCCRVIFIIFIVALCYSLPIHVKWRAPLALVQLLTNQAKINMSSTSNHWVPIFLINHVSKQTQKAVRFLWKLCFSECNTQSGDSHVCAVLPILSLILFSFFCLSPPSPVFSLLSVSFFSFLP